MNGANMLPMRAHTDPLPTAVFRRVVGKASAEYWNTILNPDPANLEAKRVKANWSQPLAEERKHKKVLFIKYKPKLSIA